MTRLSGSGDHYLRLVFTAYWAHGNVETAVFFLHNYPFTLSDDGMKPLLDDVKAVLNSQGGSNTCHEVIYESYSGWTMTAEQASAKGARLLSKPPASEPAQPAATQPATQPAQPDATMPGMASANNAVWTPTEGEGAS
jgi:hypothetical protein